MTNNFRKIFYIGLIAMLVVVSFCINVPQSFAITGVTVTPATNGIGISADNAANGNSPSWTTLSDIIITENATDDFADTAGARKTLILTAPLNWQFKAMATTSDQNFIKALGGGDIQTNPSHKPTIAITNNTIIVGLNVSGTNFPDTLTISGIQVQAINKTSLPSAGNILRTSSDPGTEAIAGITNDSTNFGSLSQIDTVAPVITLLGANPVNLVVHDLYTDAGATALDNVDGNLTASIVINNPVDEDVVGSYTVTYNVSDSSGNPATQVTRTVNAVDTIAPVMTLLGANPVNLVVHDLYTDAGATALDNYDGDITAGIVTVNPVNKDVIGAYTVTYNVSDAAGNPAIQVVRTVNVVDITTPVITLLGANPMTIEVNTEYIEPGFTAIDNVDGDITNNVATTSNVNKNIIGVYTVTYNVSDSSGNPAPEVIRTINIVDTAAPVITLNGANPQVIEVGSAYSELGATVSDNYDIGLSAIINATAVNTAVAGSYLVTYNATDAAGNPAIEVIRTINIVDTAAPAITLNGANPQVIEVGSAYSELGATVSDNYDIGLSAIINATAVNTAVAGSYLVTYNATDTAGNIAQEKIRTVNVRADVIAPVITLLGANPVTLEVHAPYADAGATALDNVDGDITAGIITNNPVNKDVVGSYTVTYNATDSSGNPATQATRTVNVVDTIAPVITLLGANPVNLVVHDLYADAGATALDNYDGDLTAGIVTVNPVNTAVVGSYIVTYNVSDAALNSATQATRTVVASYNGGGGGGGGGGGVIFYPVVQTPQAPQVPQTPQISTTTEHSTGKVLGATVFRFTKTLQNNSRGNDVIELQKRLTQEGIYSGPITGYFGSLTLAAVKNYQKKNGIETVGIVGPKTRNSLNKISGQTIGDQTISEIQAKIEEIKIKIAELQVQLKELQK